MRNLIPHFLSLAAAAAVTLHAAEPTPTSPPPAQSRSGRDLLLFKNGDTLHGSLTAVDPAEGLHWNRADALSPFVFDPKLVSEVQLAGTSSMEGWTNTCTIYLANGDQLDGKLLSFDGQNVAIDTWYAGQISLPQEMVGIILPLTTGRSITYEGPTGIEDWTIGKVNAAQLLDSGQWHYQNGAFYGIKPASIARDVDLPDVSSLQFDLQWRGFFHIAIALYTEYLHPVSLQAKESEPKFGGFYSVQINPFSANLLPVKQTEPHRSLGQAPLQNLSQRTSAHVDIRVNKHKRTIALLIDGQIVKQWNDPESFAGTGEAIRFVHQGQGAVKLSNIKVSEWDGHFEEPPSLTPNKSHDLAKLRNGDRIMGPIKEIQAERLSIEAAGRVLEIPLSRVKQVELAAAKPQPAPEGPNVIRAHFASSGALTFELEKWTPEGLVARSPSFGTITFKPAAFNKLVFDLEPAPAASN